jgi:CRISPR-associated protein Csd1
VYWFKEKVTESEDPLIWVTEPEGQDRLTAQQAARDLLNSIQTGKRPDLTDNHYHAMTISGAGGRVMVRDWLDGPFKELVSNINQWFDDLEINVLNEEKPARLPGLEKVITCLLPPQKRHQKYEDWIKPISSERLNLLHAAINGSPIAHGVISRLIIEHRDFIVRSALEESLEKNKNDLSAFLNRSLLYTRMGLIKAFHLRKYKKEGNTIMAEKLKPTLNEDFPSPAYQSGRLMAVLAELQKAALKDVGAGVVQRYYAAAVSCSGTWKTYPNQSVSLK